MINDEAALTAPEERRWLRAFAREPIVHFVLLAALLFAANSLFAPPERETVLVNAELAADLERRQSEILGRPLTPEELTEAIEAFIDNEVLIREARRMGFDNDSRVRQHLSMKMRSILDEGRPKPTVEQLRAMYDEDPARRVVPARYSVQVVRVPDGESPEEILKKLPAGDELADLALDQRTLPRYTVRDIARAFGDPLAEAVTEADDDAWRGPLETSRGNSCFRVTRRYPPRELTFEEVDDSLRQEWEFVQRRGLVRAKSDELRERYNIIIEPREVAP